MTAGWDESTDEEIIGSPDRVWGNTNTSHHTSIAAFWTQKRTLSEILLQPALQTCNTEKQQARYNERRVKQDQTVRDCSLVERKICFLH